MANEQNLRRWKPGESGNPAGRPKHVERWLRELLGDDLPRIALAMRNIALGIPPDGTSIEIKGSDCTKAAEWIYNRCYGQPKQTLKLEDDSIGPGIDWSAVPIEKRRELLAAAAAMRALTTPDVGDTEH